ncbi:MAG: hypothetical protein ACPGVO_02785 [Spirulinaceae cyanobacterium]
MTHEGKWHNTVLTIDDTEIGTFANQKALKKGARFTLEDDSMLEVKLVRAGLRIRRNRQPIPGSSDYSKGNDIVAVFAVASAGIINLFRTLVVLTLILSNAVFGVDVFANLGLVTPNLVVIALGALFEGLIFVGLSFLISKYSSMIALIAAIALQTTSIGLSFVAVVQSTSSDGNFIISFQIMILFGMLWGVSGLQKFKTEKTALQAKDTA